MFEIQLSLLFQNKMSSDTSDRLSANSKQGGMYRRMASTLVAKANDENIPGAPVDGSEEKKVGEDNLEEFRRDQSMLIRLLHRNPDARFEKSFRFGACDHVPLNRNRLEAYFTSHPEMTISQMEVARKRMDDRIACLQEPPQDWEREPAYIKSLLLKICGINTNQPRRGGYNVANVPPPPPTEREMLIFRTLANFDDNLFMNSITTNRQEAMARIAGTGPGSWLLRQSSIGNSSDGSIVTVALTFNSNKQNIQGNILLAYVAGLGFICCSPTDQENTALFRVFQTQGMPNVDEERYVDIEEIFANFFEVLTKLSASVGFELNKLIVL